MEGKIKADQLEHTFNEGTKREKVALRQVDLEVSKGEFVVLLGHNGSGKSTLAKHLNAIYLPTGGKVYIDGLDSENEEELWFIRQKAGMVFQNPDNQLVATTVEEDVAFGPENLGLPSKEIIQRVDEALRLVRMDEFRRHAPHQLSGGQKQRVAIAGIIAMRPDYLILDEPTAMLDPTGRKEVIETLVRLNKEEGLTIILITHFIDEGVNADRVLVMEEGSIVLGGAPKEVFKKVEKLKELRLEVPQMTELAYLLNKEGIKVPEDIMTVSEMVDYLCQLK